MINRGLSLHPTHLIVSEDIADLLAMVYDPNELGNQWGVHVLASSKLASGDTYLADSRHLGALVSRQGLVVESWRDPAIRSWHVQAYIEPVVVIHRPQNIVKLQGLDGSLAVAGE